MKTKLRGTKLSATRAVAFTAEPVRTLAIWGVQGSPGKSTLAINLSDIMSHQGRRVLLVDCDLVAPSLALAMSATEVTSGLSVVCALARSAQLDASTLEQNVVKLTGGVRFDLIPGITGQSRWPEVTPSAIETLLIAAASKYDTVVFDLSSSLEPALRTEASALHRNELTRHLIANCDDLIMVAGADPVSTQRALRQIQDATRLHGEVGFHLVINRLRTSVLGARPERQLERTYRDLVKRLPNFFLPDEPKTIDEAMRHGLPARLVRRSSQYVRGCGN